MSEFSKSQFFSNEGNRNDVRMRVINEFANETPGQGDGEAASRYTYYVETLADGRRVYLRRPAFMHVGFDFVVKVENSNFAAPNKRARNAPSHQDIISDLEMKRSSNPAEYARLYALIEKVYACHDVADNELQLPIFSTGFSTEAIVKILKWLFIEQDIRYWSYSGREMLWSGIPEPTV